MPEPNSDHVVSTPNVDSNRYDATSDAPLGEFKKLPENASGWGEGGGSDFPSEGKWKQT